MKSLKKKIIAGALIAAGTFGVPSKAVAQSSPAEMQLTSSQSRMYDMYMEEYGPERANAWAELWKLMEYEVRVCKDGVTAANIEQKRADLVPAKARALALAETFTFLSAKEKKFMLLEVMNKFDSASVAMGVIVASQTPGSQVQIARSVMGVNPVMDNKFITTDDESEIGK